jgi:hypothetical protein
MMRRTTDKQSRPQLDRREGPAELDRSAYRPDGDDGQATESGIDSQAASVPSLLLQLSDRRGVKTESARVLVEEPLAEIISEESARRRREWAERRAEQAQEARVRAQMEAANRANPEPTRGPRARAVRTRRSSTAPPAATDSGPPPRPRPSVELTDDDLRRRGTSGARARARACSPPTEHPRWRSSIEGGLKHGVARALDGVVEANIAGVRARKFGRALAGPPIRRGILAHTRAVLASPNLCAKFVDSAVIGEQRACSRGWSAR